jgi:hypothetical protein
MKPWKMGWTGSQGEGNKCVQKYGGETWNVVTWKIKDMGCNFKMNLRQIVKQTELVQGCVQW